MSWTIEIWINLGTNHDLFDPCIWSNMILSHLVVVLQSTASKTFAGSPATFETSGLAPLCHKGSFDSHMIEECHEHRLQPQLLQTDTHLSYKSCKRNQHMRSLTNENKLSEKPTGWEHKEYRGQSSVKVMALICSKFPFSCIGQVKLMRVLHERAPMCDKGLFRPQSQLWLLRFFKATRSQDWFAAKIWQSDKCSWKCNFNCALLKQMHLKTATRRWELAS